MDFHICFFFFKQKAAYELRISDWSSDVCSSELRSVLGPRLLLGDAVDAAAAGQWFQYGGDLVGVDGLHLYHADDVAQQQQGLGVLPRQDRKSGVQGKSVSVRVDLGGRRILKNKNTREQAPTIHKQQLAMN